MKCDWLTVSEEGKILTCGSNYGVPRMITRKAIKAFLEGNLGKFYDILNSWTWDKETIQAIERKLREYTE